jgi:NitT/TauT family transport system permease protein
MLALAAAAGSEWITAGLAVAVAAYALLRRRRTRSPERKLGVTDGAAAVQLTLLAWQLASGNFALADRMLFPPPEKVLRLFWAELPDMWSGLLSSLFLLGSGYLLALAAAIPAGVAVGYSTRINAAGTPFIKVLSAIPPIVYIPYAIALLPSFSAASIFVIFVGAFWPVLVNTIHGVRQIAPEIVDSAKMLHLTKRAFFLRVILPGAMPSICTGATLGLVLGFLLLTAAELIGATEGLGWYVKNFSDFADYDRVIVGIIFIGIVVTAVTFLTDRIERRLLRYREVAHD